MRTLISLVFYVLGLAMGFILLFPFAGKAQSSYTFGILGLAIAAAALIYGIIIMNDGKHIGSTMITSSLTPLYKFFIPILTIELFVFNSILLVFSIYPGNDISIFIALEVMLVVWLLLLFPCFKLSQIELKDGKVIASNFFSTSEFNRKDVKRIKRYFIFYYKVKTNKTSLVILPKLSESVNLFVIPKSIRMFNKFVR